MEQWKDILNFEGRYQISDKGRVKSIIFKNHRILKNQMDSDGYEYILLHLNGKNTSFRIHRLVLLAFKYNPDFYKLEGNHINGIKTDNSKENLEWCTRSENVKHSYDSGLSPKKLKEGDYLIIKNHFLNKTRTIKELMNEYNISDAYVYYIVKNY